MIAAYRQADAKPSSRPQAIIRFPKCADSIGGGANWWRISSLMSKAPKNEILETAKIMGRLAAMPHKPHVTKPKKAKKAGPKAPPKLK